MGWKMGIVRTVIAAGLLAVWPLSAAQANCEQPVDAECVVGEAVDTARTIENPLARLPLLCEAARQLPSKQATGLLGEARAIAEAVEDPGMRGMALMEVARAMGALGMPEGPALVRGLAVEILENGPNDEMLIQFLGEEGAAAEQIRRIARFQAEIGDAEGAEIAAAYQRTETDKVDTLFTVAETLAQRDPASADRLLRQAMRRLAGLRDPSRADHVKLTAIQALARMGWYEEALAMTETTHEITARIDGLGVMVVELADAGDVEGAQEQYERIAGLSGNDRALYALIMATARAGEMERARDMLGEMEVPVMRDQAIADLAAMRAAGGDLNEAMDIVADLPEGFQRDRGLRLVLTALVENGRLDLAEDYAAGLPNPGLRNLVIAPIVAARARAGDIDSALETARAASTPDVRAAMLLTIAKALAETQRPAD